MLEWIGWMVIGVTGTIAVVALLYWLLIWPDPADKDGDDDYPIYF